MVVGHSMFFVLEKSLEKMAVKLGLRRMAISKLESGTTAYLSYDRANRLRRCRLKLEPNRREKSFFAGDMEDVSFEPEDTNWQRLVQFSDKPKSDLLRGTGWAFVDELNCVRRLGDAEHAYLFLSEIRELNLLVNDARRTSIQ